MPNTIDRYDFEAESLAGESASVFSPVLLEIGASHTLNWFSGDRIRRRLLIGRDPSICDGEPIIIGTRISVANIIEKKTYLGWSRDKLLSEYPHLNELQLKACEEYYEDNTIEIDKILEDETEIQVSG